MGRSKCTRSTLALVPSQCGNPHGLASSSSVTYRTEVGSFRIQLTPLKGNRSKAYQFGAAQIDDEVTYLNVYLLPPEHLEGVFLRQMSVCSVLLVGLVTLQCAPPRVPCLALSGRKFRHGQRRE